MSARYTIRVSAELIEAWDTSLLPDGLRIVEIGPADPAFPWRIVTFDDDSAPGELDGQMVTPLFRREADGTVAIVGRDLQLGDNETQG
jgi:hypothetical protein